MNRFEIHDVNIAVNLTLSSQRINDRRARLCRPSASAKDARLSISRDDRNTERDITSYDRSNPDVVSEVAAQDTAGSVGLIQCLILYLCSLGSERIVSRLLEALLLPAWSVVRALEQSGLTQVIELPVSKMRGTVWLLLPMLTCDSVSFGAI
jgi:hypothetical protein